MLLMSGYVSGVQRRHQAGADTNSIGGQQVVTIIHSRIDDMRVLDGANTVRRDARGPGGRAEAQNC